MNKTNRIRTFFVLGAGLLIGSCFLWNYTVAQKEKSQEAQTEEVAEKQTKEASATTGKEKEYVIVNEDGYLTVYKKDLKTIYCHTAISYQELSTDLQKQIDKGYWIQDTQELYDFLENYSS